MTRIITVAAAKGGVGKTTLAYELAAALNGVLVDLDWDQGGATRMWGHNSASFKRAPLIEALEAGPGSGKPPAIRRGKRQPSIVPSHPDLASMDVPADHLAECLVEWADIWDTPYVVVDTHPGLNSLTDGAMSVANAVVVPVILGTREMDALDGLLGEYRQHPLVLVPNMLRSRVAARWGKRLIESAGTLPVTTPISEYVWIRQRLRRSAITLEPNPGVAVARAAGEYRAVAEHIAEIANRSEIHIEVPGVVATKEMAHV